MSEKDDGGPALPQPVTCTAMGDLLHTEITGMTLRDYFAARAMAGDWSAQSEYLGAFSNEPSAEILDNRAVLYYRMADAMLKARDQ